LRRREGRRWRGSREIWFSAEEGRGGVALPAGRDVGAIRAAGRPAEYVRVGRGSMHMHVRIASADDLPLFAELLDACMLELFSKRWSGTIDHLAADLAAGVVQIAIAGDREPIGFVAWAPAYDLHHCVRGGEICDLYVRPSARGRAVAPALIAFACRQVELDGGIFIRGTAVANAVPLYARVAWGWDCREIILGGRAFRTVADLAGASPRELARGLPDPAWNHEA
jgi:GNAT superfamily N-acetyltransferase